MHSSASWWSLRFTIDTPLPLAEAADAGLAMLASTAATLPGARWAGRGGWLKRPGAQRALCVSEGNVI